MFLTRSVTVAATFFICAVLAGCSSSDPGQEISGKLLSVPVSRTEGVVDSVRLQVQNHSSRPRTLDFLVIRNAQAASFWSEPGSNVIPANDAAVLTLSPKRRDARPAVGDKISIRAVDTESGDEYQLDQDTVRKDIPDLVNPGLQYFPSPGSPPVPGWQWGGNGMYQKLTGINARGASGVILTVHPSPPNRWTAAELFQDVGLKYTRFHIRVMPNENCDGDTVAPRRIFGVLIQDGRGSRVVYCISSAVRHATFRQLDSGRELVIVLPGKLNSWSDIAVDPSMQRSYIRLFPSSDGLFRVDLLAASDPQPSERQVPVHVAFSDIRTF